MQGYNSSAHEVLQGGILRCHSLFCGHPTSAVPDRLNRLSMVNIWRWDSVKQKNTQLTLELVGYYYCGDGI